MDKPNDAQIVAARDMVEIDRKLGRASTSEVEKLAPRRTSRETTATTDAAEQARPKNFRHTHGSNVR